MNRGLKSWFAALIYFAPLIVPQLSGNKNWYRNVLNPNFARRDNLNTINAKRKCFIVGSNNANRNNLFERFRS